MPARSGSTLGSKPTERVMMLRKRDSLASSGEMRPGAHLLLDPGVVLGQLARAAVAVEVGARVADVAEVDVAVREQQGGQRRPHPGQLGVGHRRLVDVAIGLDDRAAQERVHRVRRAGGRRSRGQRQQARLADLLDLALEDLDRHAAGALAAQVPAHAVGDGVEAQLVVAEEAVLVVVRACGPRPRRPSR